MNGSDDGHRQWMEAQLIRAAEHFELTVEGEPKFGWHDRTIGSRAISADGERWLRVSWSHTQWTKDDFWTGNQEAATIVGVPKPTVLDMYDMNGVSGRTAIERRS